MSTAAQARARRLRRRIISIAGVAAVAFAIVATPGSAATASPSPDPWHPAGRHLQSVAAERPPVVPASAGTVHWAVNRPLCSQPADPTAYRCYAMKRVQVPAGTPGAYRYVQPDNIGLGPAGGYNPDDLAAAYGYNPNINRSTQLVGIVDWYDDPHALSDLNHFDATYRLHAETATSFRKVNQLGRTSPLPKADVGSSGEIALDVEAVRAVCHTCRILLIEANSGTDANLAAAENLAAHLGATEISNSFGEPERKVTSAVYAAYNHPGIVITVSTGDQGWFGWDLANNIGGKSQDAASFPATHPDVVAVGGTALALNNNGTRNAEIVWNEDGPENSNGANGHQGATGGGCSKLYAAPAWQAHYPGYAAAGCRGKRLAADVAALADPQTGFDVYDTWGHSAATAWQTTGGTSLAAPLTAAMFALAGGAGGSLHPAASLYVNGRVFPTSVFDIVPLANSPFAQGSSFCGGVSPAQCGSDVFGQYGTHNPNALGGGIVDCSFTHDAVDPALPPPLSPECNTVRGYDGPTGLGTPRSLRLYTHTNPAVSILRPATQKLKRSARFVARVAEPIAHTAVVRYVWTWGDGRSTTTTSATTSHAYVRTGRFTVTLTVIDTRDQTVAVRTVATVTK